MIPLIIPTLTQFERAAACVDSASRGSVKPSRILVIDNSGGKCPPIPGATIILGRQPQSVAKAWNDGIGHFESDVLISNDDITFGEDTIAQLVAGLEYSPRAAIVGAIEGQTYSCFALRYLAHQEIGPFDEIFKAAYFEDDDHARRVQLGNWRIVTAPSTIAHVGSATLKGFDAQREVAHHESYRFNERYYIRKWGGKPHSERYTLPWNGGTPNG